MQAARLGDVVRDRDVRFGWAKREARHAGGFRRKERPRKCGTCFDPPAHDAITTACRSWLRAAAWERRQQRRHWAMRYEARRGLKCVQATSGRTVIRELGRGARKIGPERAAFRCSRRSDPRNRIVRDTQVEESGRGNSTRVIRKGRGDEWRSNGAEKMAAVASVAAR